MRIIDKKMLLGFSFISLFSSTGYPMEKVPLIDTLVGYANENILHKNQQTKGINVYANDLNKAIVMHNFEKIKSIVDEAKKNLTDEQQKQLLLSNPLLAQAALCKDEDSINLFLEWGMSHCNEFSSQERFSFLTKRVGPSFSSPLGTIIDNCCWIDLEAKDWIGNTIKLEEQIAPLLKYANDLLTYEDFLNFAHDGLLYLKANCAKLKPKIDDRGTIMLNWFLMSLKSLSIEALAELIKKNIWIIPVLSKEQLIKIFSNNSVMLTRGVKPQNQNKTKPPEKLDTKQTPAIPIA